MQAYYVASGDDRMAAGNDFARRITDTRKDRGITRSEFARLVGVTPTAVWNWEENGIKPRSEALSAIARVLGVTELYLKTGNDSGSSSPATKTVAAIIESARNEIAAATGLPSSRVKVHVEFSSN